MFPSLLAIISLSLILTSLLSVSFALKRRGQHGSSPIICLPSKPNRRPPTASTCSERIATKRMINREYSPYRYLQFGTAHFCGFVGMGWRTPISHASSRSSRAGSLWYLHKLQKRCFVRFLAFTSSCLVASCLFFHHVKGLPDGRG